MFHVRVIDNMGDYTEYTALSNDTTGLAESAVRVTGAKSLEFDKVDGAANGATAAAYRTVALNLEEDGLLIYDKIAWSVYCSTVADVASCYVKLGSSASNNLQWTVADSAMSAGWSLCEGEVGSATLNGTGWDPSNITYMEVGVTLDAQNDTLANIKFDSVAAVPCRYTTT